jgi:hypothetical protein
MGIETRNKKAGGKKGKSQPAEASFKGKNFMFTPASVAPSLIQGERLLPRLG